MNGRTRTRHRSSQSYEAVFGDADTSVADVLGFVWSQRLIILVVMLLGIVIGFTVAFTTPETYRSTTTLFITDDGARSGSIAGLGGLTRGLGLDLQAQSLSIDVSDLARSRRVRRAVLSQTWPVVSGDRKTLFELWGLETDGGEGALSTAVEHTALDRLEIAIRVVRRPTDLIVLSVVLPDADAARAVATFLASHLRREYVRLQQQSAKEEREFVAERLRESYEELQDAEARLVEFIEANQGFRQSPTLLQKFEALQREVGLLGQVYATLRPRYELARIEEVRRKPMIEVLDVADLPVDRYAPSRSTILVVSIVLGVLTGVAAVFMIGFARWVRSQSAPREEAV